MCSNPQQYELVDAVMGLQIDAAKATLEFHELNRSNHALEKQIRDTRDAGQDTAALEEELQAKETELSDKVDVLEAATIALDSKTLELAAFEEARFLAEMGFDSLDEVPEQLVALLVIEELLSSGGPSSRSSWLN